MIFFFLTLDFYPIFINNLSNNQENKPTHPQGEKTMTHQSLWNAIRTLAELHGLTCSGLAKLSGLDSTTFNKSKQFSPDGTPRWPSCSTIAKITNATNTSIVDFAKLCIPGNQTTTDNQEDK